MKAMIRKATALGLAALLGCAALTGCGKGAAIDPSKTLMTVNGEDIRLGVGSFYAKYTQAQIYQFYNMYFGGSNSIFGSVSNEETGETYGDSMKQSALDDVKKMAVISQHAEEYGVSLTDEDNQKIDEAAFRKELEKGARVNALVNKACLGVDDPTEDEVTAFFEAHREEYAAARQTIVESHDALKDLLRHGARGRAMDAYVAELREKAKIEYEEAECGCGCGHHHHHHHNNNQH